MLTLNFVDLTRDMQYSWFDVHCWHLPSFVDTMHDIQLMVLSLGDRLYCWH